MDTFSSMTDTVAELKEVPLRNTWPDEETDFTPWLAENITYLEDELKMTINIEDTEANVGNYFADIYATDAEGNLDIIIENQYGKSDHTHLGQSIVYAGGFDADIVIWIAEEFDDPHIDAIQWINERTETEAGVFGVEISLVQIEDSAVAPRFSVVEKPSQWKALTGGAGLSDTQREHLRFWSEFDLRVEERGLTEYTMEGTVSSASYVTKRFDGVYIRPGATANNRIYCMLRIVDESGGFGGLDKEVVNQRLLDAWMELGDSLVSESEIRNVEWNSRPGQKYDTVVVEYSGEVYRSDPSRWSTYHDWILDASVVFDEVFGTYF